tara:strand:- start:244 stop:429 length:186 start_codon:yes stop_codon:yes gene_type:complete
VNIPKEVLNIRRTTIEEIKTRLEDTLEPMTVPQALHVGSGNELFPKMLMGIYSNQSSKIGI